MCEGEKRYLLYIHVAYDELMPTKHFNEETWRATESCKDRTIIIIKNIYRSLTRYRDAPNKHTHTWKKKRKKNYVSIKVHTYTHNLAVTVKKSV